MNKLINDLAEHADFYTGNEWYMESAEEKQRIFVEKLAELVVLECIDTITADDGATHHEDLLLKRFSLK